ncbi:hypothetical protein GTR04_4486 [Trichophyton interdigitale]|uniref:Uncharacterized protein n=2 Tax=Trichophyton interdigitale TaxID=101480 RepID=A0A9P5CV42_9EURO|nr:hypothetical protein H101_07693 [Trichophyton interdigitale H6]KAF3892659.1 hypothetical protein GY631_4076 [Trichophyton interdigitale]KAF3893584.1 hypothetical protein GY632_4141 [Trichophyton interdigitale]KAG8208128.1 hypothetical protein GTR04_4486 [Trichophyton interdigitale]KDB21842.1 hypothetical protein H109_06232 [Trichophyton interdigitale MR816]
MSLSSLLFRLLQSSLRSRSQSQSQTQSRPRLRSCRRLADSEYRAGDSKEGGKVDGDRKGEKERTIKNRKRKNRHRVQAYFTSQLLTNLGMGPYCSVTATRLRLKDKNGEDDGNGKATVIEEIVFETGQRRTGRLAVLGGWAPG